MTGAIDPQQTEFAKKYQYCEILGDPNLISIFVDNFLGPEAPQEEKNQAQQLLDTTINLQVTDLLTAVMGDQSLKQYLQTGKNIGEYLKSQDKERVLEILRERVNHFFEGLLNKLPKGELQSDKVKGLE